jgi:hypothetical protein
VRGCFVVGESLAVGARAGREELIREEVRAGVERALVQESSHTSPGNILKTRSRGNISKDEGGRMKDESVSVVNLLSD